MKNKIFLLSGLFILNSGNAFSQAGTLDSTFGNEGLASTFFIKDDVMDFVSAAVDAEGKIVVTGTTYTFPGGKYTVPVARYLPDGTPDSSFDYDGFVKTDFKGSYDEAHDVVIQPDGRIIIVGAGENKNNHSGFLIARYKTNGALDSSFGGVGYVVNNSSGYKEAISVLLQPDGKIISGGIVDTGAAFFAFGLARYNEDGSLDNSFGEGGMVSTYILSENFRLSDMALQTDGKIIATGSDENFGKKLALVRYQVNGSPDSTFGEGGIVVTAIGSERLDCESVDIQSDGKIIVGGTYYTLDTLGGNGHDMFLARYNPDGTPDLSFGNAGIVIHDQTGIDGTEDCKDILIQPDGKIIGGGFIFYDSTFIIDFWIVRFQSNGTVDSTFGTNGAASVDFFGTVDYGTKVLLQPGGKLIFVGITSSEEGQNSPGFGVARFLMETPDCNVPTDLVVTNINATSAKLSWNDITDAKGYKARYKVAGTTAWTTVQSADNDKTINSLTPNTKYAWQVKSICGINPIISSEWSEKQFFTTLPAKLGEEELISSLEIYPNPFSSSTTISFSLEENSHVVIELFDLAGRKLKTLLDEKLSLGIYHAQLNRQQMPAGIYLLQIKMNDIFISKKLVME